jgi:hypothetical protein
MEVTNEELGVLRLVRRMMARTEYLLPIVAAERQLRDFYYRLNAAALLEDLFHDAVTNYVKQTEPTVSFLRADAGSKGWDYEIAGVKIAHKTFSGGNIAAIWDATVLDKEWNFEAAMLIVVAAYKPVTIETQVDSVPVKLSPLSVRFPGRRALKKSSARKTPEGQALLVHWHATHPTGTVLYRGSIHSEQTSPWKSLPFEEVWRGLSGRGDRHANECEVLVTQGGREVPDGCPELELRFSGRRPGVYLIPKATLQNVPVKANNRGLLVHADLVQAWLDDAKRAQLFVPMPLWYQAYAEDRPPDLYSVQRAEYDALFSARGFRR